MPLSVTNVPAEQLNLLRVIAEPFVESGQWPVFDYVERTFVQRHALDAGSVLSAMERVPAGVGWSRSYGLAAIRTGLPPRADERVSLTIAGCYAVGNAAAEIANVALLVIDLLARKEEQLVPNPNEVAQGTLSSNELEALIREVIPPSVAQATGKARDVDAIGRLLSREPATSTAIVLAGDRVQSVNLQPRLRAFRDAVTVEKYLDRTTAFLSRFVAAPPPALTSQFSLLGVIEYADVVWQLRFKKHLLGTPRPSALAVLDDSCSNERDFLKLLSSLSDVIDGFGPELSSTGKEHKTALDRTEAWLKEKLEPDAHEAIDEAIRTLRSIRHVRNGQLHAGAQSREARALEALGVGYPVTDLAAAWGRIQREAIDSLEKIASAVYRSR